MRYVTYSVCKGRQKQATRRCVNVRLVSTVKVLRIGTQNAYQIKIADFNGDGRVDYVVTHIDLASLGDVPPWFQMFIGDGQGNFTGHSQGYFAVRRG